MKKLISMTDFVFLMRENKEKDNIRRFWSCEKYAKFLKQPLTLGMFVPCDEDGNVLEEPEYFKTESESVYKLRLSEYQQAKERVLFYWSEHIDAVKHHISQGRTIEYLANFGDIELTPSALKQIGL